MVTLLPFTGFPEIESVLVVKGNSWSCPMEGIASSARDTPGRINHPNIFVEDMKS